MAKPLEIDEVWSSRIVNSVNGLEYGTVQIVVHDGRIVQIERTERKRFESEVALREQQVVDARHQGNRRKG
ncbi:YezD family protein [Paenibacillus sp. UNC451MF]|uniref:YezD family protein n=1 Tax=Paenibacillus sp. UNC451MF TaxID=1449063 RepID=UPI00048C493E|nr:YezD family protein [Paenibacillus sp. UNC451MF]